MDGGLAKNGGLLNKFVIKVKIVVKSRKLGTKVDDCPEAPSESP